MIFSDNIRNNLDYKDIYDQIHYSFMKLKDKLSTMGLNINPLFDNLKVDISKNLKDNTLGELVVDEKIILINHLIPLNKINHVFLHEMGHFIDSELNKILLSHNIFLMKSGSMFSEKIDIFKDIIPEKINNMSLKEWHRIYDELSNDNRSTDNYLTKIYKLLKIIPLIYHQILIDVDDHKNVLLFINKWCDIIKNKDVDLEIAYYGFKKWLDTSDELISDNLISKEKSFELKILNEIILKLFFETNYLFEYSILESIMILNLEKEQNPLELFAENFTYFIDSYKQTNCENDIYHKFINLIESEKNKYNNYYKGLLLIIEKSLRD